MTWDEPASDGDEDGRAPICPSCGVTALPMEGDRAQARFVCEHADCEAFGEEV